MSEILVQLALGIVQGMTEWLPVSSSGHLALVSFFTGTQETLAYDVFLHVASLLVIAAYFRTELASFARGIMTNTASDRRMLINIIVATIVTIPVAVLLEPLAQVVRMEPRLLGAAFIITSLVVGLSFLRTGTGELFWWHAVWIGFIQGVAVIPGISRSGVTIGLALLLGLRRDVALKFSFFSVMPIIAAAFVYFLGNFQWRAIFAVGFITVVIVGYFSLWLLDRIVKRGGFHFFAIYTIVVALTLLVYA